MPHFLPLLVKILFIDALAQYNLTELPYQFYAFVQRCERSDVEDGILVLKSPCVVLYMVGNAFVGHIDTI